LADKSQIKLRLRELFNPFVSFLSYLGISPMAITFSGIILSVVGAVFLATGRFVVSGLFLLVSGLCDVLDGSLARREKKVSIFGAFIDSTGDRIGELLYFGAIIFYFSKMKPAGIHFIVVSLVAIGGSFLTSYTRARAEGLGISCSIGVLERPERVAILVAGLLFGPKILFLSLIVIAVLSSYTAFQRIMHVKRVSYQSSTSGSQDSGNV